MIAHPVSDGTLFADRAYIDAKWAEELKLRYNVTVVTPHKKLLYEKVPSGDTFSTYVSSMRQPIESLFNWLNVKTGIQNAFPGPLPAGAYSFMFFLL